MELDSAETANGFEAPKDVREFVRQHFFEGIPYEMAAAYTAEDADVLLKMLANPDENEEFLPEIVTTLCFIGSEKAVEPLIRFVQGPLASEAAFRAKNAALIHLGDLINKTNNKTALDFLANVAGKPTEAKTLAAPRVPVAEAEAKRADVTPPTADELTEQLAVSAALGLGLSGTEEAEAVLNGLQEQPSTLAAVKQALAEAAKICKSIRSMGQEQYYKSKAEKIR